MTEIVLPSHTNALGSIFGGVVMSWVDICAAISAQRHSKGIAVTASIDALNFVNPIYVGWVVTIQAMVNYAFTTSMEVGVRVDAENPMTGEKKHTASAYLTFVALDKSGKPRPIPKVQPETAEEKRRYEGAQLRRKLRLENKRAQAEISHKS